MAEYLIQSEDLVAIADKIRVLSGSEDAMSLDAMRDKIGDANISVEAALSALINKGVNIPDGANIGNIADLIGSVEAELPELSNPAIASELFVNKELIDADGNVVTGTFTIDSELSTQDSLISQIQNVVNELPDISNLKPNLQTKIVTPTTSTQTIKSDSGYDGLSQVTVNAIPGTYVKPTATKAATTYTPTTSNQTIAAGTYCSGVQTIKGDANLKAENIAEGVSIFGITGTHSGGSGGGIEYEIVNLTNEGTSIPFTLKRVTSTFGMMTTSGQGGLSTKNAAHYNLSGMSASYMGSVSSFLRNLFFEEGVLTSSSNFIAPYMAVFINDPSAEAIYEE